MRNAYTQNRDKEEGFGVTQQCAFERLKRKIGMGQNCAFLQARQGLVLVGTGSGRKFHVLLAPVFHHN